MSAFVVAAALLSIAVAQTPTVPSREIPPSVLVELQLLENRFDLALAADCDPRRCFSKGCTYVDHAVADRPRSGSLPGLGQDPGPGATAPQDYLTRAQCSFAHESSLESADVQALVRRLQSKLSMGWTVVSVDHQVLQPIPQYLREPPEPEILPEPEPEPAEARPGSEPEPDAMAMAGRELWTALLPHFFWMIGLALLSLAGTLMIWAWRRVGRVSVEEQALLAELARTGDDATGPLEGQGGAGNVEPAALQAASVADQLAAWSARLDRFDADNPDLELQALIRELLRSGDLPLLAKAALRFPDGFLAAFPSGGEIASAKLELAEFLKTVDEQALPSDAELFQSLHRHALAAALATQGDAQLVGRLQRDFGAAGLVGLIGGLPARIGAILFALAPPVEQVEMVRLLSSKQVTEMAGQLLSSNRMDPSEAAALFAVLGTDRGPWVPPGVGAIGEVTDRGTAFDAVGALSVLLPRLEPARRAALFDATLQRFHGGLPAWHRGIFLPDMLRALPEEAQVDLLLEVDAEPLAAWLSLLDADVRAHLTRGLPDSLRATVGAAAVFPSRARQLSLAARGRRELARGFQRQLARAGIPFERVVQPVVSAGP